MDNIILYSTGCPKCAVLKRKLNEAGINYITVTDEQIMEEKGYDYLPVLEVDGTAMDFSSALKWI